MLEKNVRNTTYIRLFLGLAITLCIVVLPFTLYLSSQFSRYALQEIEKNNRDKRDQIVELANFMLTRLRSYGLSMSQDPAIQAWFRMDGKDFRIEVNTLIQIGTYESKEPLIEKTFLVNRTAKQAIDSRKGIVSYDELEQTGFLGQFLEEPANPHMETVRWNGRTYLGLRMPVRSPRAESDGYVIVLFDNLTLETYLLQHNSFIGINAFILDKKGGLVLGQEREEFVASVHDKITDPARPAQLNATIRGNAYSVGYSPLSMEDWGVYYSVRLNALKKDISVFQNKILLLSGVLLALLLAVVFIHLRKTYKPITDMTELLSNEVEQLASSMREHQDLIKAEYLKQWLLQGTVGARIRTVLEKETGLFQGKGLRVAVFRIHAYYRFCEEYSYESRKLLKYAAGNIAVETARKYGLAAEWIDLGGDHGVLLMNRNGTDRERLRELLSEAGQSIRQWLKLEMTIAVSDPLAVQDDIRFSYDHVYDLTMLRFISGVDKIYFEDDFQEVVGAIPAFPEESVLNDLLHAVRMCRRETVHALLDRLFQDMDKLPYAECRYRLLYILYMILRSFNRVADLASFSGAEKILERFTGIREVRSWLQSELERIMDNVSTNRSVSRKEEIVRVIEEYVGNHLNDPLLTADSIADHVFLSVSYIRQLFKEVRQITLADYIQGERLAMVKKELETTDRNIADIAEQSGFQSKSHFFMLFKKSTGMTPAEYRQLHRKP